MKKLMAEVSEKPRAGRLLMECSGACGDLGTFIPHVIGAMTVAGLAPASSSHIYDQTVTARFDAAKYWTFKVEGHFMDGVASSMSSHGFYLADNPQGLVPKTNLLVVKMGFNF